MITEILKNRFCQNMTRHPDLEWDFVEDRLNENKDKYLVPYEENFSCDSVPIEALCVIGVLASGADVEVMEVFGVSKLKLLIDNLFIERSIMFYENNPLAVSLAARLAEQIRVIVIGRPDGRDTTEEQYEKLMKVL